MLNIAKNRQPDNYTEWKTQENPVNNLETYTGKYEDLLPSDIKQVLQEALCKEQGYICCYCMNRIYPNQMRLEHWESQKLWRINEHGEKVPSDSKRKFDYTNMMAACCGGEPDCLLKAGHRVKGKEFYCDKSKENLKLKFSPAEHDVESKIKYAKDGKILSTDDDFDDQLNSVLNLNRDVFKSNRAAVLDGLLAVFQKVGWTKRQFENRMSELRTPNARGELRPYAGVELYELKKRHARAAR